MRLRIAFVFAAVVGMMASAMPGEATHRWGKYHWKGTGVRNVQLINSVTSPWGAHLSTAAAEWNTSAVLDTSTESGPSDSGTRSNCPAVLGKVRVCNYTYGTTGWLGIAQIWIYRGADGHIAQGIVEVNDTYFNTAPYNTSAYRQFVMCQEVGHTFGLDHQDENQTNPNLGSCMDYTRDPDGTLADPDQLNNEHPNAHDFAELATIYSHNDGAKKGGPGAGSSAGSSRSVQVRQDGEYTVVTFILWA